MYTYKCYFHPKADSEQPCRGCKLPICVGCTGTEGFCPECAQKREAVQHLRHLRTAKAAKGAVASTTGRLRLARRQANGERRTPSRVLSPSGALVAQGEPPRLHTRPLIDGPFPFEPARPAPPKPSPKPRERRYNPNVAYRPVGAPKPERRRKAKSAASGRRKVEFPWFAPFMAGIGVGVVLMVITLLAQPFLKSPASPKPRPKFSLLSQQDKAAIRKVLATQVVDTLGRSEAPAAQAPAQPESAPVAPRPAYVRRHALRYAPAVKHKRPLPTRQPSLAEAMIFTRSPEIRITSRH